MGEEKICKDENLYNRSIECPACGVPIEVTDVKLSKSRVIRKDEDTCPYYNSTNVLFYDVWICPNCGYAALSKNFENISSKKVDLVRKLISPKWMQREFTGERDLARSLECYKLALVNAYTTKAKQSEIANICLRIAWMYRYKNDSPNEQQFLKYTISHYESAYATETFPMDKIDEPTLMYLMGEFNRRIGEYDKATSWFGKVIGMPSHSRKQALVDKAREQWDLVKASTQSESNEKIDLSGITRG
jgi:uncharacterized protein (DUF2225 family)